MAALKSFLSLASKGHDINLQPHQNELSVGGYVRLQGLVATEFNGQVGKVVALEGERCSVSLESGHTRAIKLQNLKPLSEAEEKQYLQLHSAIQQQRQSLTSNSDTETILESAEPSDPKQPLTRQPSPQQPPFQPSPQPSPTFNRSASPLPETTITSNNDQVPIIHVRPSKQNILPEALPTVTNAQAMVDNAHSMTPEECKTKLKVVVKEYRRLQKELEVEKAQREQERAASYDEIARLQGESKALLVSKQIAEQALTTSTNRLTGLHGELEAIKMQLVEEKQIRQAVETQLELMPNSSRRTITQAIGLLQQENKQLKDKSEKSAAQVEQMKSAHQAMEESMSELMKQIEAYDSKLDVKHERDGMDDLLVGLRNTGDRLKHRMKAIVPHDLLGKS